MPTTPRRIIAVLAAALALVALPVATSAYHAWGDYHWPRTSDQVHLDLGDAVHSAWDGHLDAASADWNDPGQWTKVIDTTVVSAGDLDPRKCSATAGRVNVCAERYGFNGWLGVARIWISGSHIYQGTVKLNDSYFAPATSPYNTPLWRQLVMCQEIGHTFGLDHQDEDFDNTPLGTCMDYSSSPTSLDMTPNGHDFEELAAIYSHPDGSSPVSPSPKGKKGGGSGRDQGLWGRQVAVGHGGRTSVHVLELGGDQRIVTFVTWAEAR